MKTFSYFIVMFKITGISTTIGRDEYPDLTSKNTIPDLSRAFIVRIPFSLSSFIISIRSAPSLI